MLEHPSSGQVDASIYVPALGRTARLYHFAAHIIGPKEEEKTRVS
ncbi:hypothetical protein [Rickettsiella endosymbiont of Dermanyssus gallinae]|nr:hypothetical protein [Rickettsiella endosymbiont of Dermanyssus gallinae]